MSVAKEEIVFSVNPAISASQAYDTATMHNLLWSDHGDILPVGLPDPLRITVFDDPPGLID